ncbi:MAG: hypothetical protein IIC23_04905 [Chloroflexi bacterium]|nr:hypothetical protein [Chloroflexota bacterium]
MWQSVIGAGDSGRCADCKSPAHAAGHQHFYTRPFAIPNTHAFSHAHSDSHDRPDPSATGTLHV